MKNKIISLIVFCLLSACVYGPKVEHKSPLNSLNGENYETSALGQADTLIIPVVKRKAKTTRLQGEAMFEDGINQRPIKFIKLQLKKDAQVLAEATTNTSGKYNFSLVLTNGMYLIEAADKKYSGHIKFNVDRFVMTDLVVPLIKK
jgi:hypothetical protein